MKKTVKPIKLLVLCVLMVCLFSSCEKAGTELSDLMIIQGIGIDTAPGGYRVTVEILNNEQSGSPGGDSSSDNKTKIYNAEGESVGAALMQLTTKSGNKPFYAHNRVIVLGEEAANSCKGRKSYYKKEHRNFFALQKTERRRMLSEQNF